MVQDEIRPQDRHGLGQSVNSYRTEKLRVCFFIPSFGYGGAQKQCILLLNELRHREDLDLTLIRFSPGPQDPLLNTDGIRIEFVPVASNFDPRAIWRTLRVLKRVDADVLLSWIRVCDIYAFFIRQLRPRTAWVLTQRNSHTDPTPLYRLRNWLGRQADAIAANSPGGVEAWRSRKPRGEVFLVDNMAAPSAPAMVERQPGMVLFVGRLTDQKNIITTVRAFAVLARSRPDLEFVLCGDGELRGDLEKMVAEEGLASRFRFLGFRTDAVEWIARAQLLVSLSHYEGMPNVLMEGVSAGTTVVASDIAEHRELLGEDFPYLVKERDDPQACAAVIEVALQPGGGGDVMRVGRERIARMEPRAVADAYAEIFASAAAKRSKAKRR